MWHWLHACSHLVSTFSCAMSAEHHIISLWIRALHYCSRKAQSPPSKASANVHSYVEGNLGAIDSSEWRSQSWERTMHFLSRSLPIKNVHSVQQLHIPPPRDNSNNNISSYIALFIHRSQGALQRWSVPQSLFYREGNWDTGFHLIFSLLSTLSISNRGENQSRLWT